MSRYAVHDSLWVVLYAPGYLLLRVDGVTRWLPASDRGSFRRTLAGVEALGSQCQLAPVPRFGFERVLVADSAVLWVRSESSDETTSLLSWSPKPTFIFRDGDTVRHTAIWALRGELSASWTKRLNRRLAHAIGTVKRHADPANFIFTPPGALTEAGKRVRVVRCEPDFFSAKELTGRLRDAPDTTAVYRRRRERIVA